MPRQSRAELCLRAGVHGLISVADFLGIPHRPPQPDAEITLSEASFNEARRNLRDLGIPIREDRDATWLAFRSVRARYEPLLAMLGRMTDAPRSEWSPWSDNVPLHRPPLLRIKRR